MKRAVSFLIAMILSISIALPAYAATDSPPYSLKYLQNIDGVKYVRYNSLNESDGLSDVTVEIYDVIDLWIRNNASWDATVRPFRDAFKNAGFEESIRPDTDEYDNQPQYTFIKAEAGQADAFLIYSEKRAHAILNEGAIVYIHHARMATESDTEQANPSNGSSTPAAQPGFNNFTNSASYESGRFTDVNTSNWFETGVKTAYELGLMNGNSATTFNPDGETTIAETLALACRIHSIYQGESPDFSSDGLWYQPYVDYAVSTGMIKSDEYSDYTKKATRANFANIIYASLPANTWTKINNVDSLPDVQSSDWFGAPVFALYNAGILTGSDKYGTFNPSSNIKRSEVATIVTRVAIPNSRSTFTLENSPTTGSNTQPAGSSTNENKANQQDELYLKRKAALEDMLRYHNYLSLDVDILDTAIELYNLAGRYETAKKILDIQDQVATMRREVQSMKEIYNANSSYLNYYPLERAFENIEYPIYTGSDRSYISDVRSFKRDIQSLIVAYEGASDLYLDTNYLGS